MKSTSLGAIPAGLSRSSQAPQFHQPCVSNGSSSARSGGRDLCVLRVARRRFAVREIGGFLTSLTRHGFSEHSWPKRGAHETTRVDVTAR